MTKPSRVDLVGVGLNATDTLTAAQLKAYRPVPGLYCCPSAITIQADPSDTMDVVFDQQFYGDNDGVTYVCAIALLLLVSGLASFVPALRAACTDPMNALRTE